SAAAVLAAGALLAGATGSAASPWESIISDDVAPRTLTARIFRTPNIACTPKKTPTQSTTRLLALKGPITTSTRWPRATRRPLFENVIQYEHPASGAVLWRSAPIF